MAPLAIVDTFTELYEHWDTRPATLADIVSNGHNGPVKSTLTWTVKNAVEAAVHMSNLQRDNAFGNFVANALKTSAEYRAWHQVMPKQTPSELSVYQKAFQKCTVAVVSKEIDTNGCMPPDGQFLFHGGLWPGGTNFVTSRPLSTSLCPQVALLNAEYSAKAYFAGRLDLWVLRVTNPITKAFVFKARGTNLGHEFEVLFAAGAQINLVRDTRLRADYPVADPSGRCKTVPFHLIELEIS